MDLVVNISKLTQIDKLKQTSFHSFIFCMFPTLTLCPVPPGFARTPLTCVFKAIRVGWAVNELNSSKLAEMRKNIPHMSLP